MAGNIVLTQTCVATEVQDPKVKFHPKGDGIHKDQKTRERILDTFGSPTQVGIWLQSHGATGSRYALWTPQGTMVPVRWDAPERQTVAIRAAMVVLFRHLGCSEEDARALAVLPKAKNQA